MSFSECPVFTSSVHAWSCDCQGYNLNAFVLSLARPTLNCLKWTPFSAHSLHCYFKKRVGYKPQSNESY